MSGSIPIDNKNIHISSFINQGAWKKEENDLFIKAISLYSNDWKELSCFIKTRNPVQIRSHTQKLISKLIKKYKIYKDDSNDIPIQQFLSNIKYEKRHEKEHKQILFTFQKYIPGFNIKDNKKIREIHHLNSFYIKGIERSSFNYDKKKNNDYNEISLLNSNHISLKVSCNNDNFQFLSDSNVTNKINDVYKDSNINNTISTINTKVSIENDVNKSFNMILDTLGKLENVIRSKFNLTNSDKTK